MKKIELYEDVLKEEPKLINAEDVESKEYKKWEKRLHNSVGWIDPMVKDSVFLDHNGKIASTTLGEPLPAWDVRNSDGGFTCDNQEFAEILSILYQMNERIKKIEEVIFKENGK